MSWRDRQRKELGDAAFKRLEAERMRQSRERRGRQYDRARGRVISELIRRHRTEFDRLLKDELGGGS